MRLSAIIFILAFCPAISKATEPRNVPGECQQCLVVVTDSWSAQTGQLYEFFRRSGRWHPRGTSIPVVTGKAGLGWGRGLLKIESPGGPIKKEGDNKAPAGVFRLRSVFGYARRNPGTKMPYLALSRSVVAVDDPKSRYYNQLVAKSQIKNPDWRTAEKMILADDRYKWGMFVEHNIPPRPGAGSCIFLHVWKNPTFATTGCTATAEKDLVDIIRWLDPARHPLLVQLPRSIYSEKRAQCGFPEL